MIRWIRSSPLRFATLVLALTFLSTTVPVHALDCQAVDLNEMPRNCTFLEEYGSCLENARASWAQCIDKSGGSWWRKELCNAGGAVDLIVCGAGTPFSFVKAVF